MVSSGEFLLPICYFWAFSELGIAGVAETRYGLSLLVAMR